MSGSFQEDVFFVDYHNVNSVDPNILQHMIDSQSEFLMEVTDKTIADVKVRLTFLFAIREYDTDL